MFIKMTVALMAVVGLATGGMYYYSSMECTTSSPSCCHGGSATMPVSANVDSTVCPMSFGSCEALVKTSACCSASDTIEVVDEVAPMPRLVSR